MLVKELIFRKAALPLALNRPTGIFHGLWDDGFPYIHLRFRTPFLRTLFRGCFHFCLYTLSIKSLQNKLSYLHIYSLVGWGFTKIGHVGGGYQTFYDSLLDAKKGRGVVKKGELRHFWKGNNCLMENYQKIKFREKFMKSTVFPNFAKKLL